MSIIESAVSELHDIRQGSEEQRRKTEKEKRLGGKIRAQLRTDGRKKDCDRIALTTFSRYLTRARRAISATGYKHHSFDTKLAALKKAHKDHTAELEALEGLDILSTVKAVKALSVKMAKRKAAKDKALAEKLEKLPVVPEVLKALALTSAERAELTDKKDKAIAKKQSDLVILKADKVLALMASCLASKDPYALALGVALATGRRSVEVLIQGIFTPTKDGALSFTGQAKESIKDGKPVVVTITPLADAALILDALERLRASQQVRGIKEAMTEDSRAYTANELFNNHSRTFTRKASELFTATLGKKKGTKETAFNAGGWRFKDSRAIFARMSYEAYKVDALASKKALMDDSFYFTKVLGHSDTDAQKSYRAFAITGDVKAVQAQDLNTALEGKEAAKEARAEKRLKAIKRLAKTEAAAPYQKIFDKLIAALEAAPCTAIASPFLRAEIGGKATRLGAVLAMIKEKDLTNA